MHGQAHFLTFSCYKRRRILDEPAPCQIVLEVLASQFAMQEGKCQGFVIMPDHVHALVWSVGNPYFWPVPKLGEAQTELVF